jgi:hypothetical protein
MNIFKGIFICTWILVLAASAHSSDSVEGTASQPGLSIKSSPNVFIPSSASIVNTLLIETGGTITNTVVRALDSLGVTYDFMNTVDFTGIDFSPYATIILGMDGGLVDSTSVEAVANATAEGKKLIILGGTAYHPYYVGVQNYLLQHNGVEDWVQSAPPHLTVTAPGHPLTLDLPSPYNYVNPYAAQYMLRITDPAATVVAMNGDGFPALVSKSIGNGVLIYSITSPWDAHYANEADYQVLYTIVRNAVNFSIPPPPEGTLFASTGAAGNTLLTIDPTTGQGTSIAPIGAFGPVTEIEFRDDGVLFGATGQGTSHIIVIDPLTGIEDTLGTHLFGATNGLEFDGGGNLLGTWFAPPDTSWLVEIDQSTGQFTSIAGPTGVVTITGLTFHSNGTLYGVGNLGTGAGSPSSLYTITPATGVATLVGPVGFDNVGAMEFGPNGVLYGGVGAGGGASAGYLLTIDPATGAGTAIGASGYPGISGLSFYPSPVVSIDDGIAEGIPKQFELYQNYPNPFNPTTTIRYQLPVAAKVKITIYNLLGQKVITLVDEVKQAGIFKTDWDGLNQSGIPAASGIYIYRVQSNGFVSSRKMVLLK